MIKWADKVVVAGEKENWPDYLIEAKEKVVYWDIEDPVNMGLEGHREIRDRIKIKIVELVKDID